MEWFSIFLGYRDTMKNKSGMVHASDFGAECEEEKDHLAI
jgi:hypothetical protein